MDFDEHDEGNGDEEMPPMPLSSSYEPAPLQPGLGAGGVPKPGDSGGGRFGTPGGGGGEGRGGARYRECLKNHAVGIGGHAVDGCGEFMAAGEEGSIDALRCAACGCHRNFHRKESDFPAGVGAAEPSAVSPAAISAYGASPHHQFSPYYRTPAGYLHHQQHQMAAAAAAAAAGYPQRPLALPSTSHSGHDEGDDMSGMVGPLGPMVISPMVGMSLGSAGGPSGSGSGRKRFRTKFTQEQKDKMLAFAERLGWRIQKHDDAAVQQFCEEVCVKRHVLKVWMHNNKHTLGKKP
ncbi:hypothetical protein GUJ93_ZPchr0008g12250 [Zizania palustris]|uniref:ZF-HD dimerization-type domain-containing protein n=1 Tax=Zizania palustris TaxID=103762 RepID=A0A8J5UX06_ZIZPA|nr:hypothetical protein GUJ93_ZPchr0008g12250 [Zizania palustris]